MGPHFVDMLMGRAVDLVEVHVRKSLPAIFAEVIGLLSMEIFATTAAIDRPRNSSLSADGDSLSCTVKAVSSVIWALIWIKARQASWFPS